MSPDDVFSIKYTEDIDMCNAQKAITVWIFGLSGAGKTTFARSLAQVISVPALHLDGDEVRKGICSDLGFSSKDRACNVTRVAHIAKIANDQGINCIVSMITPCSTMRNTVREIIGPERFRLVHMSTPLAVCAERDCKGLYLDNAPDLTGVGQTFETPSAYEATTLTLDTSTSSLEALQIMALGFARKENLK